MPVTPLHLGIGACCKAVGQKRFSFMIFAGTQVLMDIEPLLGLIYGWLPTYLHTQSYWSNAYRKLCLYYR